MSEVTRDCLDAETLAAWMDDGLSPAALDAARAHVSGCARCQALVATMVRIEPAPAAAPARARWWLPWLVPVATVAAAATLWFALPRKNPDVPALQEESKQAFGAPAAPATPPPAAAEPAAKTLADQMSTRDSLERAKERGQNAEAKNEVSARARADKDAKKADSAASRPAPPAAAAATAAEMLQEAQARLAAPSLDRRVAPLEVRSPDAAVRWRVVDGRVEHTIDTGTTWIAQQLPVAAPIVAGVSPSRSVCWLVGGNGLVLLTTDGGQIWRRLAFPELTALASVTAADAVSATVRTADGREFTTKDSGITWNSRRLQDF